MRLHLYIDMYVLILRNSMSEILPVWHQAVATPSFHVHTNIQDTPSQILRDNVDELRYAGRPGRSLFVTPIYYTQPLCIN